MIRWIEERAASRQLWQIDAAGVVLCVVLACIWVFAGMSPLAEARADRRQAEDSVQQLRGESGQLAQVEKSQKRKLSELRARLAAAPMRLTPAETVNERVRDLTALASEHGLRIDEIKPGSPEAGRMFTKVPIKLAGAGPYQAFAAFLHSARERFPDTGITRLDIRGEPEAIDRPARYSVELVWHASLSEQGAKK